MAASYEKVLEYHRLLGVEVGADDETLRKAYRKRALDVHPDKNRDDPDAASKFDAVNKAYDALTDKSLRTEFEKKIAAKAAEASRYKEMDESKRKMREVLEAKEKAAAASSAASRGRGSVTTTAAAAYAATYTAARTETELSRLRREGQERIDESNREARERLRAAEAAAAAARAADFSLQCGIRAKWSGDVNDAAGTDVMEDDSGERVRTLSEAQIEAMFSTYGPVLAILSRRARSAAIVFARPAAATQACESPPLGFKASRLGADPSALHPSQEVEGGASNGTGYKRAREGALGGGGDNGSSDSASRRRRVGGLDGDSDEPMFVPGPSRLEAPEVSLEELEARVLGQARNEAERRRQLRTATVT